MRGELDGRRAREAHDAGLGSRVARIADLATAERTMLLDRLTRPVTVVPMDGGAALVVQLSGDILEIAPAP